TKEELKGVLKKSWDEKDERRVEVSDEFQQTKESTELEAIEVQPTPLEDQPTEIPTPTDTEVISKTKKIKMRVIKPRDIEAGEEIQEELDQTKESIQLEAAEIQPTPLKD